MSLFLFRLFGVMASGMTLVDRIDRALVAVDGGCGEVIERILHLVE